MFNPMELMGKLKQMQDEMAKVKEQLSEMTVTAETGAGMVKVVASGDRKVLKIDVEPDVWEDQEMALDLIVGAVNMALEKAEVLARDEVSKVSTEFMPNIPGFDMSKLGGQP